MAAPRKPTLKQLFNAWLKYEKKSREVMTQRYELEKIARAIGVSTELVTANDKVYRVTVTNYFSNPYKIEKIADVKELDACTS